MSETAGDDNRNVYLDNQGNYRDNTPENRDAYPPAGVPGEGEPVPFTDEGKLDGDALAASGGEGAGDGADGGDTVLETGTDAPVAKTRKQS